MLPEIEDALSQIIDIQRRTVVRVTSGRLRERSRRRQTMMFCPRKGKEDDVPLKLAPLEAEV